MTDHAKIKEAKELIGNEIVDYENLDIEGSEKTLELYRIIFSILSKLERGEMVEPVLCGDCKYSGYLNKCLCCLIDDTIVITDGYCSRGEPAGKEQDDGK